MEHLLHKCIYLSIYLHSLSIYLSICTWLTVDKLGCLDPEVEYPAAGDQCLPVQRVD